MSADILFHTHRHLVCNEKGHSLNVHLFKNNIVVSLQGTCCDGLKKIKKSRICVFRHV